MAETPRPEPVRNSTGARARWWKPAALGLLCALAGGMAGWFGHSASIDRQMRDDRAIASGELPLQRPTLPLEPLPAPEPEATPAPTERPPQVGEAFVERFDGSVDARWSVSDGWSNGDWMTNDWRRSSVETATGLLALKLQPGPESSAYRLASGELQSHARHRYGYFEVRMKVPRGAGLVTGFFSYAGQEGATRPNEIDIEILGRNTRVAELTIHENGKATSTKVTLPFDAADGFHVYGFDWQPGHVRWYIDGQLVHAETGGAARRLVRPQQLILNLWASEQLDAWVGRLDLAKAPWQLDVSCMAYAPVYPGPICG
jgi:endo-1,3-1,4-beta-glycanase ExoK